MNIPNQPVRPLFTVTTPIRHPNNEGHGTGFFFTPDEDSGESYLITNHHVIANEEGDPISESVRIVLRPSEQLANMEHYDVSLIDNGKTRWLEHPSGSAVDVVAIPLPDIDCNLYVNKFITPSQFLPNDVVVQAGEEAMIMGYPILDAPPYLPVVRSALIASPYGTGFRGQPCFATDANMHSGTSGSPVFTLPKPYSITEGSVDFTRNSYYFLGIHSATLLSDHESSEGPLNLNLTWYGELLKDIIGY